MCSKVISVVRVLVIVAIITASGAGVLRAQVTTRVSVDSQGREQNGSGNAKETARSSLLHDVSCLPLAFVENRGQFDERACFAARRRGMTTYFTKDAFVLQLVSRGPEHSSPIEDLRRCEQTSEDANICGASVFLTFEGALRDVVVEGIGALPGRYNYFIGNDPSKWRTNVPAYSSIRYSDLYPGIDVLISERESRLEYDTYGAQIGTALIAGS